MRRTLSARWPAAAAALALGALLPGCSSSSSLSTPAPSLSAFFNSVKPTTATDASSGSTGIPQPDFECPDVSIRAGASTMTQNSGRAEDGAMNLRYQVGISQTARECKLNGNTVTMRIGVQGRVVLGPAGTPGQIDLPIRVAVVHEGPSPRTVATKLNRVPVMIADGTGNAQYTMIEEDISFPMPRPGVIDEYIVYVGFDPQGMREPPRKPARAAPRQQQQR